VNPERTARSSAELVAREIASSASATASAAAC
jgi:hypothetical protein